MVRNPLGAATLCVAAVAAHADIVLFDASTATHDAPRVHPARADPSTLPLDVEAEEDFGQGRFTGVLAPAPGDSPHANAAPARAAHSIIDIILTPEPRGIALGNAPLTPDRVEGSRAGLTYVNLYSPNSADGEIRAQVIVAAPSSGALALIGFGSVVAYRRTNCASRIRQRCKGR